MKCAMYFLYFQFSVCDKKKFDLILADGLVHTDMSNRVIFLLFEFLTCFWWQYYITKEKNRLRETLWAEIDSYVYTIYMVKLIYKKIENLEITSVYGSLTGLLPTTLYIWNHPYLIVARGVVAVCDIKTISIFYLKIINGV